MKKMRKTELRTMQMTIRSEPNNEADDGKMLVEGYAAVFDSPTLIYESPYTGYRYMETIAAGAFVGADMQRTVLKYNHCDNGLVLARTSNGTLQLEADARGLRIRAELAPTTQGRDIYALIQRGDLDKMSFAFTVAEDEEKDSRDTKELLRTIKRFDTIYDVSVVDFPAYDATSITARNNEDSYFQQLDDALRHDARRRLRLMSMC